MPSNLQQIHRLRLQLLGLQTSYDELAADYDRLLAYLLDLRNRTPHTIIKHEITKLLGDGGDYD